VFVVPGLAELRRYAQGDRDIYLYARYGTPTVKAAEDKIAALEGAEAAVITASGMSAILIAALATCRTGDEIVSMLDIYGGTVKLFEDVLGRCGIKSRFIPYHDLGKAARYFSRKTRMLFLETPTNPTLRCADIAALSEIAHRNKVAVVVDNTFATPVLQKPLELGADMVMHSATKYLGGHSDLTAGVLAGSKKWMDRAQELMILTGGCLDPGSEASQGLARLLSGASQPPGPRPRDTSDERLRHDGVIRASRRRVGRRSLHQEAEALVFGHKPGRRRVNPVLSQAVLSHWVEREAPEATGGYGIDPAALSGG
jgi:selenocysteine lyase/cysteine desulfurase